MDLDMSQTESKLDYQVVDNIAIRDLESQDHLWGRGIAPVPSNDCRDPN